MTKREAIKHGKEALEVFGGEHREFIKLAIECIEKCEKYEEICDVDEIDDVLEILSVVG